MSEKAPMPGYACFVFHRHAIELYDLTDNEAIAYMRDLRLCARAVAEATGAAKLNYEIHGNTLPHLHVHIFPRHHRDRFSGRPIDPREVTQAVYAPGEWAATRSRVAARIAMGPA
jgi:diadenosine tetraphosphate (Ap4A) HIT family hydrolase